MKKINEYLEIVYKYRYYIALVIFILCVLFEISGSSIGMWKNYIDSDTKEGVILGQSRGIRSDEWAVYTPMLFSQVLDGFKYISDIIRGGNTDIFMIYGLPVLNLVQIFRPFQLGFIFLGAAKGLSFFWCGRIICLFLVMLELGMVITKKNKLLSFTGAIIITLSPIIQWWFAVNELAELFIFGGLLIILLEKYMITNDLKKRCLYLLAMVICAGGYVLILYPSWQVPIAYVFLALAIWTIIENRKECKISFKDIILIIIAFCIFAGSMGYILSKSLETIKTIMNTVYPGARSVTGGTVRRRFFYYIMNIFMPFNDTGLPSNACEESLMFSMFPAGIILAVLNIVKSKKKDILSIILLITYAFLGLWCTIGFPNILAKLTLLSFSQAERTVIAIGFLDVLILLRSLTIMDKPLKVIESIGLSVIITIVLVTITTLNYQQYLTKSFMIISMSIMCLIMFYFSFRYKAKYVSYLFTCGITAVMLISGATVNPLRIGIGVIYNDELISKIQQINKNDSGKWIVEDMEFPNMNYILMAGVPVINCTNVYPDLEKWHKIDKEEKYNEVYNRYAHITVKLIKNEKDAKEKFELKTPDSFNVNLLPQELKKLEVKYIFTKNQLEQFNNKDIKFEKIEESKQYKIYKVN